MYIERRGRGEEDNLTRGGVRVDNFKCRSNNCIRMAAYIPIPYVHTYHDISATPSLLDGAAEVANHLLVCLLGTEEDVLTQPASPHRIIPSLPDCLLEAKAANFFSQPYSTFVVQ
jgi:hypothetical protein